MSTIGYKEAEELSKAEVALRQLNDAIGLFVSEHFISSLTLAGAADGVLSGLLRSKGKQSSAETSIQLLKDYCQMLDLDPEIANKPKRHFYNRWNFYRNRVKHHDQDEEEMLLINGCDSAYWMIGSACANAKRLGLEVSRKPEFDNWAVENVHL